MLSIKNVLWTPHPGVQKENLRDLESVKVEFVKTRNIKSVSDHLSPVLRKLWKDPFLLGDMDKATDIVAEAVLKNKVISVIGDYDVDGSTSSALLYNFFSEIGIKINCMTPDRYLDGYGPSKRILESLRSVYKTDVVLVADSGTTAFEAVEHAKTLGMKIIVLDHHPTEGETAKASALINPNKPGETIEEFKPLAAVGVSFLFIHSLFKKLREIKNASFPLPDLNFSKFLDLVAIGTICDVMPLTGLNRIFVMTGLSRFNESCNEGIRVLSRRIFSGKKVNEKDIGFYVGPLINAGGRVGNSGAGVHFLTEKDPKIVESILKDLVEFNKRRKSIETSSLSSLLNRLIDPQDLNGIVCFDQGLHLGVLGILAARLKDKFLKPSCVLTKHNGEWTGSIRSIPGIDVGKIVGQLKDDGVLTKGGGHAMAAGVTLREADLEKFIELFNGKCHFDNVKPQKFYDGVLAPALIDRNLQLNLFGCFRALRAQL